MKFALCFTLLAVFILMLYGWGWAFRRLCRASSTNWAATAATGMAAVVFAGGVLNLAGSAHAWAVLTVAGIGAGLAVVALIRERPGLPDSSTFAVLIPAVAVLAFVAATQVPPRAYNYHDDFQKYFGHVVRMLQTGTVFGSSWSVIGIDTLGGQAFLQSFAVALFPIRYINVIDAGFALFLCMMLAAEFAEAPAGDTKTRSGLLPMALLCSLAAVLINPQYVNISALYTGAFLIMALMWDGGANAAASPWITGLLYAALIALKSNFVLFPLVHLTVAVWIRGWKWAANAAAAVVLFLAPWLLIEIPHYAAILTGGSMAPARGVRNVGSFNIFSTEALDFGATAANYTWLMIAIGVCGALMVWARHKLELTSAMCFASIGAYLAAVYISGPRAAGYDHAIRYFAPFTIGIAPAAFGSAAAILRNASGGRWRRVGLPLLVSAAPVLAFAPSAAARVSEAVHAGSVLAFDWLATDPEYLNYSHTVMDGQSRRCVEAAQAAIPAGAEAFVWINAPFYLDFKRNSIVDVEPSEGLVTPWARMPGARYFIFEYSGYANLDEKDYADEMAEGPDLMRRSWAARLEMTHRLMKLMRSGDKLYDDGSIAVFRR